MENRQEILHKKPIMDIENCYGKPLAPCEADEETCPYFTSCTQITIDSMIGKLKGLIRIDVVS